MGKVGKNGEESTNFYLTLIDKIYTILKKISISQIIKGVAIGIFTIILVLGINLAKNPEIIFERYDKYAEAKHNQSFARRMEVSPIVQANLDKLLAETKAYRAFIVEMHNGRYNSAGLSFNYGALTYESLREEAASVREDYAEFSLERYPLTLKIYHDGYWCGLIDDLYEVDQRLALRMKSNDIHYAYITMVYSGGDAVGFLGVTYIQGDNFNSDFVKGELLKYSSKIGALLDGKTNRM